MYDENRKWQSLVFKDVRSKADAEKRLAVLIGDRERGKLNLLSKKVIPTFSEYCQQYLALIKQSKCENTYLVYKRALNTACKRLGDYQLHKLSKFILEKYRIDRKVNDGVKPSSLNQDMTVLNVTLNSAMQDGLLSRNPCGEFKAIKQGRARDRILSDREINLVLTKLQGKDRLMVMTALFTGMRLNEVLSLQWTDIDFTNHSITFTQSKTGKTIVMPMSDYLRNELISFKGNSKNGRVFEDKEVNSMLIVRYSTHFGKLFRSLGIENFTFHGLRHTFTSLQSSIGTDIATTQSLLGHSDISQTLRYSHSKGEAKQNAIDMITNYILATGRRDAVSTG